ncbi:hypothetical protein DICSQDRAFT_165948 [Dichomitus squalens LYAD-421 SS1]|uniref:uncharacterized protein n=1 Tax=Dichomitus squalens (strain LYAD-421) TaxID=732165 RepID=UPI00044116EB|nr:uncharacterized protein DICSQDRAFT_165948 [Dichomitus squalens LYAD-421 SS1]EJF66251.1 hypothetical protein DICSQDRAFT_165948 [Dichomitus squalens LYAD-421 SS1]
MFPSSPMITDHPRRSISDLADGDSVAPSSSQSLSSSSRKSQFSRDRFFRNKHGSKVHAYDPNQAPWPLSYDKSTLELEMMDTALTSAFKGVVSLVDHKGKEPARCLDIGTGLGLWIVNSAKYWKNSTFVGFDLVDIQIPVTVLPDDEAARIEWVHGNILTDPLPFSDGEFDHVRLTEVALGVPENKWPDVFEEVRRVMKQGGTIEIIEEDAIFPVLPRWFTEPLHARTRWPSISMQDRSKAFSNPQVSAQSQVAHEYELLEILFENVFQRRFINMKPSSSLPAYFSVYFGHVLSPPVLTVPMPPLPPVQPRPPPRSSTSSHSDSYYGDPDLLYDAEAQGEMSLATLHGPVRKKKGKSSVKRTSSSISPSGTSISSGGASPLARSYSEQQSRKSLNGSTGSLHGHGNGNNTTPPPPLPPIHTTVTASGMPISSGPKIGGRSRSYSGASMMSMASKRKAAIQDLAAASTVIGGRSQIELFPLDGLLMFDVHSLCLHLRRALGFVLAIREAMWEELASLVTSPARDVDLTKYGFFPHEDTLENIRSKYLQLLDQYKSDMHVRMSLWHSLVHFGWDYPQRDPMSKAEEMEEVRLREDILMARREAGAENEREPPCRAVRMLVGAKV